jgi:hypothetical protein
MGVEVDEKGSGAKLRKRKLFSNEMTSISQTPYDAISIFFMVQ